MIISLKRQFLNYIFNYFQEKLKIFEKLNKKVESKRPDLNKISKVQSRKAQGTENVFCEDGIFMLENRSCHG